MSLVDGVPFYDASTIQRTINLNSLDIKSVQRIEVIKGSQSVLYGGQALSGVIKIETIPRELKNSGYVLGQSGSSHDYGGAVGAVQSIGDQSAVVARGSFAKEDASSPVLDSKQVYPTQLGSGEIAYINRNSDLHSLIKVQTTFDKTLIATTGNVSYAAADADRFETSTYQLNSTGFFSVPNSYLKPTLAVSLQKSARLFEQDFFASRGQPTKSDYVGDLLALRFEVRALDFEDAFQLQLGTSFNQEKMVYRDADVLKTDQSTEFEGFFAKGQTAFSKHVGFEFGVRSEFNQMKNEIQTYQVGASFYEDIRIEYSTGFKQPSLFQLFSSIGNVNLRPEKSTSTTFSIDHKFSDNFFLSYSYFISEFENLIIARGNPFIYENVNSSNTKGHELAMFLNDFDHLMTYNLTIGYQEPFDNSQGTWLLRRPLRTASVKIRKDFELLGFGGELIHNGSRRDRAGQSSYGTLSSYTTINLVADYKIASNALIFSRAQNIADQRFESTYGFYDEGLNIKVGAEYDF